MPITPSNPFKGRQYPGEVILLAVRWYLRYPLAYLHLSEILAERGLFIDASCIWRWVQAYAPELDRRCRPHLKPTKKSYRVWTRIRPSGRGSAQGRRCPDEPCSPAAVQILEQHHRAGSQGREETCLAGKRIRFVSYCMADSAGNRNDAHDQQGTC